MQIKIDHEPYKISFSGTQGTGKSTASFKLLEMIQKKQGMRSALLKDGIARECAKNSRMPINQKTTMASQLYIFSAFISNYYEMSEYAPINITSRSIWDVVAYTTVFANGLPTQDLTHVNNYITNMEIIAKNLHYDHIFVLDPEGNNYNAKDQMRDNEETFRTEVHEALLRILDRNIVKCTIVKDINLWFGKLEIERSKNENISRVKG